MGKRDTQMSKLPVDHFRKQIGKHNKKSSTIDVKKIKKQSELKQKTTRVYKDVKVVVGGFVSAIIIVYLAMFVWYYFTEGYKP